MAKRSVAYKSDRGQFPNTANYKGDLQRSVQPKNRLSGGFDPGTMKYSKPIGPVKPVGQRMDDYSRQQLAKLKQKAAAPVPKPKPKPPQVIRTTVSERVTPASAPATAPARMAVNRATGDTTGFTTGKTTGKTVTKSGTAYKTPTTGLQRMGQNAFNKGGVAGPSRSTGGSQSAGPSRSTGGTRASNPSRGDVGAGRRGGGR
jgi:hypothetical protein